jgi:hypothetical protein
VATNQEEHMRARWIRLGAVLAVLTGLAVGASALASAAHTPAQTSKPVPAQARHASSQATPVTTTEAQSGHDGDNVQRGDQTTPDTASETQDETADTDNVQQGDQSAPDSAAEQSAENGPSESESGPSDGPGGFADSSVNADTPQQGEH